jgi:hypothetical protein
MWQLDRAVEDYNRLIDENTADTKYHRARYDALLEKYHALKVIGASEPAAPAKPLQRSKPDPVAEVIADRAGPNGRLRSQLTLFAASERRNGTPELEIAKSILHWQDDTSGVPE